MPRAFMRTRTGDKKTERLGFVPGLFFG